MSTGEWPGTRPVEEFCHGLKRLQKDSGQSPTALANRLSISRAQLYVILSGKIRRPPDWAKLVGPLVTACTGGDSQAVAHWRRRHALLTEVWEELHHREHASYSAVNRDPPTEKARFTRTLPRDIASFTGRESELRALVAKAVRSRQPDAPTGVYVIGGMAGVGKTAFAVHAARLFAPSCPDGQIFLALHGHAPGRKPLDPADALAALLHMTGVQSADIPPDLDARAAQWRNRLAGQRVVVVLDDAVSSEQIQWLIPGAGESLILITSRRRLTALDDASAISLGMLDDEQAGNLFCRLVDRPGLDRCDPAVRDIVGFCGHLPLAVGLVARQLHHHPSWNPAGLAAELGTARNKLEWMAAEHRSVMTAFDMSYRNLTEDQGRLLRRIGLHPSPEIDARTAAAIAGGQLRQTRHQLAVLYDHHLLSESAPGQYRLHDLIRAYAQALADHPCHQTMTGWTGYRLSRQDRPARTKPVS